MIAESGDMRRCRWILCVGGTQKDIFIAEKTDCSRIGNYDADGLQFFVYDFSSCGVIVLPDKAHCPAILF